MKARGVSVVAICPGWCQVRPCCRLYSCLQAERFADIGVTRSLVATCLGHAAHITPATTLETSVELT